MSLRRASALTGALALMLAACSDSGSGTASAPDVTFSTQPPPAGSEPPAAATTTAEPTTTVELGDPVIALQSIGGFAEPVDLAWRSGDPTLFVVERAGRVVPVRDGTAAGPVLDISALTVAEGERGLLGLTFSADGTHAYVDHTDRRGDTVIAEYAVDATGDFDEASRRVLLEIGQPYPNHNGGNVTIGPDGMLYIGMGDGGSGGDPDRVALNVSNLLGKILRIDPTPTADTPYSIPPDNPFVGVAGARPEVWSVGLRNPWRFSFDRATGDLWIADVGQNALEEVDVAWAADGAGRGMNFGWSAFEGTSRYNDDQSPDGVTPPIYEFAHGDAGCSISGGAVYRGAAIPALAGWYVFSDYCSGAVYALRAVGRALAATAVLAAFEVTSAVREGPDGELYVLSLTGDVARVVPG